MKNFFTFALLQPKGLIALQERNIMVLIVGLILIAVIPAFILLIVFTRKYRAGNKNITKPVEDNQGTKLVYLFWGLPAFVVCMIIFVTWSTTHILDPYKPIASKNPPITIQVVALQWKWLFIYPQEHIATVNFIQVPVNTPIHFDLTSDDAPMNSFWIPQLGGQMYAMTGMSSQLNLMATETGDFDGSAAEVNGQGFAGMRFGVRSSSGPEYDQWVAQIHQGTTTLTENEYTMLAKPSENNPKTFYAGVDENLYNSIIGKYMPNN